MEKILISACLAGEPVRYDAKKMPLENKWLRQVESEDRLVVCCPEVEGGMKVPRPPAQIVGGNGADVLAGYAKVMDVTGSDVTAFFIRGAEYALSQVRKYGIRAALLKGKSPSCGNLMIYDGSFNHVLVPGFGVTAAILIANNIQVYNEHQIDQLRDFLDETA